MLQKISSTSQEIIREEGNYKKAVENNEPVEQTEVIKDKIKMLKRKQALFNQAAKMVKNKSLGGNS